MLAARRAKHCSSRLRCASPVLRGPSGCSQGVPSVPLALAVLGEGKPFPRPQPSRCAQLGGAGRASLPSTVMRWGPSEAGGRIAARGHERHRGIGPQTRRTVLCTASVEDPIASRRRAILKAVVATWGSGGRSRFLGRSPRGVATPTVYSLFSPYLFCFNRPRRELNPRPVA